ncbi:MAG: hypothetical protein QOH73_574 [Gaiellaceae bacterium]|jgi:hypothetical protein|nr:hypothetical protein [Gaiellaceae bacterium]
MRRLPLADTVALRRPARRTAAFGLALAVLLLVLLLAFALSTRKRAAGANVLPPGASAIVVLDLSASTRSYAGPIANTLLALTKDGRRHLGLVIFSDAAFEALPPTTPVEGLRGWLALFERAEETRYPWASFSGGTAISTGLARARAAILRDKVAHPHVLLVSDLIDDETDLGKLASLVTQYRRDKIDLRIVSVGGTRPGESALASVQDQNAGFVHDAASATIDPFATAPNRAGLGSLALLVALLGLALAAFERTFHPLSWGRAT